MTKKWVSSILALILVFCMGAPAFAATNQYIPTLNSASLNLEKGSTAQLTANIGGTDVTSGVIWTSDTPAVVSVSKGTVTAVGPGRATVTATTANGTNARCAVQVASKGIDVSYYQSSVSWADVKSGGIDFALLRTGYGDEMPEVQTDPTFAPNYDAAVASGVKVGAYHVSYAMSATEAVAEANFCLSILGGRRLDYPVYVDIEQQSQEALSADQLTAIASAFCSTITSAGYQAGIYSKADMIASKLSGPALSGYDKWVAHFDVSAPRYNGAYSVWQYSQSTVPGISGQVDLDYSYRDYPNAAPVASDISFLSDTGSSVTLQKGKTYQFKFTPNGVTGNPAFTVGKPGVAKTVSLKKVGASYYYKIKAVGSGCTSVYSSLPGQKGARRCLVTVA